MKWHIYDIHVLEFVCSFVVAFFIVSVKIFYNSSACKSNYIHQSYDDEKKDNKATTTINYNATKYSQLSNTHKNIQNIYGIFHYEYSNRVYTKL